MSEEKEEKEEKKDEGWTAIESVANETEAAILAGFLESEGIRRVSWTGAFISPDARRQRPVADCGCRPQGPARRGDPGARRAGDGIAGARRRTRAAPTTRNAFGRIAGLDSSAA